MIYLLCAIQFGASRQQVYYVDDGRCKSTMHVAQAHIQSLPSLLVDCTFKYKCDNIMLIGPDDYIKGLEKDINDIAVTRYGNTNINVFYGGVGKNGEIFIKD